MTEEKLDVKSRNFPRNKKILIGILIVGIVLIGGWWVEKTNCRDENYKCTTEKIPCCSGLEETALTYEDEKGKCVPPVPCGSICLPCGNGICDEKENKCNCPEDCK